MSARPLIHYHSDCPFFAGCENMLANFFNSKELRGRYRISFSYRQSDAYDKGYKSRVNTEVPSYPVLFPDIEKLLPDDFLLFRKTLTAILRLSLYYPIALYEIAVLYFLFRKIRPDILHINNGGYPAALSSRAAAVAGHMAKIPKIVMVVNNMAIDYRSPIRWLDYPLDRLVRRVVDQFITGSEAAAEKLRSVLAIPMKNVVAIHNGIALRSPTASRSATRSRLGLERFQGVVFGVVALLIPRKGHAVLLEAIRSLVAQNRLNPGELKVMIEGDGNLKNELMRFVDENNLNKWVSFVGNESNVIDFMSAMDVLILPSIMEEDFPNVILEAMALGKPVIASRLAGTPEQVVDGVGLLVEPRDVAQLGDAICYLAENSQSRTAMGCAASAWFADHFTSEIALKNYSDLYLRLLGFQ